LNEALLFGGWLCFHLQAKKAPDLLGFLHTAVLIRWAP